MRRRDAVLICPVLVPLCLLLSACGPRPTESVHLPLAVGNRWVYEVQADSVQDVAVLEIIGEDRGVYALSARCTVGHWTVPRGPLYLTCSDSVLWLNDTAVGYRSKKAEWRAVLSDDRRRVKTQNLLLFRGPGKSRFANRTVAEYRVGGETYRNCLVLRSRYTHSSFFWFIFIASRSDSAEVEEVYCPEVGLVSFSKEHHWESAWWGFGSGGADSGVWHDRWELRSRSLSNR